MSIVTRLSGLLLPKEERVEVNRFNSLIDMARIRRGRDDQATREVFMEIVKLYGQLKPKYQHRFDKLFLSRESNSGGWFISKLLEFKDNFFKLGSAAIPILKSAIINRYYEDKLVFNSVFPFNFFANKVYVPLLAGLAPYAAPGIIEGLNDKHHDVIKIFAEALGVARERSAIDPLAMTIENPHASIEVKEAAIRAIREIGKPTTPRAIEALKMIINLQVIGHQIEEAIVALGKIADPSDSSSIDAIKNVLVRVSDYRYVWAQRGEAASALREIGGRLAMQALASALENGDAQVRKLALGNLACIKDPLVTQVIQAALSSKYPDTSETARKILAKLPK